MIIRRIRKECLDTVGVAKVSVVVYLFGIPIYEDVFYSSSNAVTVNFTTDERPEFYKSTEIGFKQ